MKTRLLFAALVMSLAGATQALAQGGTIGWSQKAPTCFRLPGSAASAYTSNAGVSFASSAHGHLSLVCSVQAIVGDPSVINSFGIVFDNTNGFSGGVDQCAISAIYEKNPFSGSSLIDGEFLTNGTVYVGRQAVYSPTYTPMDFNNNYYDVYVNMTRKTGATCNPILYAAFIDAVIQ